MTNSDFRTILEAFPGRKELEKRTALLYYIDELSSQFDFLDLAKKIKLEDMKFDLPVEEEVWIKFIAFTNLVNAVLENKFLSCSLEDKDILSDESLEVSEEIAKRFNEFYDSNAPMQSATGVGFYGLCRFIKKGKKIF